MKATGLKRKLHLGSSVSRRHIIKRYVEKMGIFLKYNTAKKSANLISIATHVLRGKARINCYPATLQIEVNNICQLKCPGCPTGLDANPDPKGQISYENYKRVIDLLGDSIYWIELFGFGEPLLNKDIFHMINYAHKHNIGTCISTNLNTLKAEDINKLVASGLDQLVVSMDGITQQTYQKYRRGGNIEKVLNNLEQLLNAKDKQNSSYPLIEVHFITMEHNRHEIPQTTERMRKLGLHRFYFLLKEEGPSYVPFTEIEDELETLRCLRRYLKRCHKLWSHTFVSWNGNVRPCCLTFQNAGNIFKQNFKEIWNDKIYTASRRIFCSRGGNIMGTNSPCLTCQVVRNRMKLENVMTLGIKGKINGI